MAATKTLASRGDIRHTAQQIVRQFRPDKVILFGSYAAASATGDSDIDLLVILDTDEPPIHAAARIAAAVDHVFPLDIVVFTPSAWRASLERGGTFATQVSQEGIVLYETRDRRVDPAGGR